MEKIFKPAQDLKDFKKIAPEIFKWAEENNINKLTAIRGVRIMHSYKSIIARMVKNLTLKEFEENQAIIFLAGLLNSVMMITGQDNPEYSMRALSQMTDICMEIVNKTGTPSEQFELMAWSSTMRRADEE